MSPGPQGTKAPGIRTPRPASQRAVAARRDKSQLWKSILNIVVTTLSPSYHRQGPMAALKTWRRPPRAPACGRGPTCVTWAPSSATLQTSGGGGVAFISQNDSGTSHFPAENWDRRSYQHGPAAEWGRDSTREATQHPMVAR